jgi:hypothetical protein
VQPGQGVVHQVGELGQLAVVHHVVGPA